MAISVRDEDFARRRHHSDTPGIRQYARGSRQLSHPEAVRVIGTAAVRRREARHISVFYVFNGVAVSDDQTSTHQSRLPFDRDLSLLFSK
jgi:hypothetical protein